MLPTQATRLNRIASCISDLSQNGINLLEADETQRDRMVREHIEYFQLMLGYDSDASEILSLLKARAAEGAGE